MTTLRLRGPKGTDECNVGTSRYAIHEDGYFYLPRGENIDGLLKVGGFTIAEDQTAAVAVTASRLAELEAEEATLLSTRAPVRRSIPT